MRGSLTRSETWRRLKGRRIHTASTYPEVFTAMFASHRPHLAGLVSALALATGAAGLSGLTQASADWLPAFACADASGGTGGGPGTVTSVRTAHHEGYDRLVIGFATSNAVPQYTVKRQASSTFTKDASGQQVSLDGSAGIKVVLHDSDIAPGVPSDQNPRLPEIREVANIGNFERVVSYGVGLQDQACIRVFQLSGPSRLVIDVATPADSSAAANTGQSPTAQTSAPSATSAAVADSSLPQDLATTGQPASAGQPAGTPLLPLLIGLLLAMAGVALLGLRRFARR